MKKTILIIGGTGFIGSHILKECLNVKMKCYVLSLNQSENKEPGAIYIEGDIASNDEIKLKISQVKFNYIINSSGYIDHSDFHKDESQIFNMHFNNIKTIIELIPKDNLERFIQLGSSDEYGSLGSPQMEDMREQPISPYSVAKVALTYYLQALHRCNNFPIVILRLFLVYGPNQKKNRFLPSLINNCLDMKSFDCSEGSQLRDFCYIDDVTEAIMLALDTSDINGHIINIASGNPISIREIISKVQKIIGFGNPRYGKFKYRKGESMSLYANTDKAKNLLSWSAKTSLEKGLSLTIDSYRSHE